MSILDLMGNFYCCIRVEIYGCKGYNTKICIIMIGSQTVGDWKAALNLSLFMYIFIFSIGVQSI